MSHIKQQPIYETSLGGGPQLPGIQRLAYQILIPSSLQAYKMVEFGEKTLEGIEKLEAGKLDAKYKKNAQSRRKLKDLKDRVLKVIDVYYSDGYPTSPSL